MKILNKLTIRSLSMNKVRTMVTIIGIILSTALIVATAGLGTSFQQTLIKEAIHDYGNQHVTFYHVPEEELTYIQNHKETASYYMMEELGYSYLEESVNEYKPYLSMIALDETALSNQEASLIEGRMPENTGEVLISEHISSNGGVEYQVGDTLILEIGKRVAANSGETLMQLCEYEYWGPEELVDMETVTVEIVGIVERPNFEAYYAPGYSVITVMDEVVDGANIAVCYKHPENYEEITNQINGTEENQQNPNYTIAYNETLLAYEGYSSSGALNSLRAMIAVVIVIIMITSIFCIRNSFAISITEKVKQYGMLASMGATPKQIRRNVFYEAFLLAIIGIPIGIVGAVFAVWCLLGIVNYLIVDQMSMDSFIMYISPLSIALGMGLSLVTIYFSARSSAKSASKISEIEAIRSSKDIYVKTKQMKSPKWVEKVFGVGGVFAYKNMKRNKKKFKATVLSLTVSVATFIALSYFINIGYDTLDEAYGSQYYNLIVYPDINGGGVTEANEMFLDALDDMSGVKEYWVKQECNMAVSWDYAANLDFSEYPGYEDSTELSVYVLSIPDDKYMEYVAEITENGEVGLEQGVLINKEETVNQELETVEIQPFAIEDGDMLGGVVYVDGEQQEVEVEVITATVAPEMASDSMFNYMSTLFISETMMNTWNCGSIYSISILSEDSQATYDALIEYKTEHYMDWGVYNMDEQMQFMQNYLLLFSIFLYGFITVISSIGLTNVFNAITTNMQLRRKEFAMLQSIGMTKKEFDYMIGLESIFYGAKSLLYGIPIGIAGSYLIYYVSTLEAYEPLVYTLPIGSISLCVVVLFAIVYVIMKASLAKIQKQNIIETIRNENI